VSETTRDNEDDGAGVGGGTSDGVLGGTAFPSSPPSPPSPSSFSGSSPSAEASFVSPFRLRRRLRCFFLTSPTSSAPSGDSALIGEALALPFVVEGGNEVSGPVAGAVVDGLGIVGGSSMGARESSGNVAFALDPFSTSCDSGSGACVAPLTSFKGVIEAAFLAMAILRTSSSGIVAPCAFVGAFLLNHSNDATTDTSAKSSVEGEGTHEFWPCVSDSGRLAINSHGTTGVSPSPKVSGSLPGYACEFAFSERGGPPTGVGGGGVAGPGTPSSRRARRERLSALRARTPVKQRRSVVPSKHCSMPFSVETTTPSLSSILCVGASSLNATRGKWSGLSA